jgi:hypothetical protein
VSHTVDEAAAWIYRGVWASIVALFRVPPEPPTLPSAGEAVRSIRHRGYLRYLKFLFWVAFLPGRYRSDPHLALDFRWRSRSSASFLVAPLVIVLIAPECDRLCRPASSVRHTWYVFTDRSLRIRRGIWVFTNHHHVRERSDVEVAQGPVSAISDCRCDCPDAGGAPPRQTAMAVETSSLRTSASSKGWTMHMRCAI